MNIGNTSVILKLKEPKPRFPVLQEIKKRFSPRLYSSEPVGEKDIQSMFEAARWTPSGHNNQPWYFYYTHKGTDSYIRLFSTLNEYNRSWAKTAPLLVLACAIPKNVHGENPFAYYDLGAAVITLVLQAQRLGYYSRQMGMFDKKKVKKMFPLDNDHEPFIVVAMGKIGDYTKAPQSIVDLEFDPRPRKTDIAKRLE